MPGVLTHLSVAFAGFLIVYFSFYRSKSKLIYGLAFAVGQLIPDTIKFGIPGVMFKTADFYEILSKPIYWQLNNITHHIHFWIGLFVLVLPR